MPNKPGDARKKLVGELKKSFAPVKAQTGDAYREAIALLHAFAEQVAEIINTREGARAEVKVELGHLVNQGQEHRVAVRAPKIGLSDYLLRAFVPFDGYPVVLDAFSQGDRVCPTEQALADALVAVSADPSMRQRLAAIRNLLADESLRVQSAPAKRPPAKRIQDKKGRPRKSTGTRRRAAHRRGR